MNYDIYINWRNGVEKIKALKLKQLLAENQVQTFTPVEKPIGPHPFQMFESHVRGAQLPEIEKLLVVGRKSCPVLIHEYTGDHMYNHTKGAR